MKKLVLAAGLLLGASAPVLAANGFVGLPITNTWTPIDIERCVVGPYRGKTTVFGYTDLLDDGMFIWTSDAAQTALLTRWCHLGNLFVLSPDGSSIYIMMNTELE